MLNLLKKIALLIVVLFFGSAFIAGAYDWFTGNKTPSQPPPAPQVEQSTEKPKPTVKRPEKPMMLASKNAIERITGHYVTDSWILEYDEHIDANGNIATHGFIEVDDDGVKRQFWLILDPTGQNVLRLKIDSQLIYAVDGN